MFLESVIQLDHCKSIIRIDSLYKKRKQKDIQSHMNNP